jgi:hypothetical protein
MQGIRPELQMIGGRHAAVDPDRGHFQQSGGYGMSRQIWSAREVALVSVTAVAELGKGWCADDGRVAADASNVTQPLRGRSDHLA